MVLHGHSGSGKSTLLRALYGNYQANSGHIWVQHQGEWVDMAQAPARQIIAIRRDTIGWVSQFLRVIPRVPTLEIVMQPLLERGVERGFCEARAKELLTRLNVPQRLWSLAPQPFREASSSASISPVALSRTIRCCYWTNPQRHSTVSTVPRSWA